MELLVTFLAGISMAVGALFVKYAKDPDRLAHASLSLALGALVALVLFDLGPESVELVGAVGLLRPVLLVAAGAAVLAVLEHFIPDHDADEASRRNDPEESVAVHVGLVTVLALVLHNIVEGMTMYALALDDFSAGVIYALGVALHNIPMGMLIFSALRSERRSIKVLALSAALFSTVAGGLIMMVVSPMVSETVMESLTCLALGMIAYIVLAELLPHVLRERPVWVSVLGCAIGFALVLAASLFE